MHANYSDFSILEIIFLHYVARSICETIKLPKEIGKYFDHYGGKLFK